MTHIDFQRCADYLKTDWHRGSNLLQDIFNVQFEFFRKFYIINELNNSEKSKITRHMIEAISQELSELRNLLPWKHWKKYKNFQYEIHEIRFEIIDIMCFLINISILWGMRDEEFYNYFMSKVKLNFERQINKNLGYLGENE